MKLSRLRWLCRFSPQSQVSQNFRSGSFVVSIGKVRFCTRYFGWLSLLVIRGFGGCRACRDTSPVFVIVKIKVVCKSWACLRCRHFSAVVLVSRQATQQSVHLTLGILAKISSIFHALSFFQLDGFAVPAPAQVTQTVGQC